MRRRVSDEDYEYAQRMKWEPQTFTIYASEEEYKNRTADQKQRDERNGSTIYTSMEAYNNRNDKRTSEQKLRDRQMKEELELEHRRVDSQRGSWDW